MRVRETPAHILSFVKIGLRVEKELVRRARKRAAALGGNLNDLIRDSLQKLAAGDDPEGSIEEFRRLSGRGHSPGWRFGRDEIHERSQLPQEKRGVGGSGS